MLLTNCAACAAPLAHDAPRCVRCKTRYCNATCQHDHWRRGHKQICKKIHRGGNAEQYHADKKCKEAVAEAADKCAADTKGQTCYICTEAVHWKTKEGLVDGCACRGTAGFAHVSCLAEQAKILYDEAEENNLNGKARDARWARWYKCSLCEQDYHGVVSCALGWACWKTYLGRPEGDGARDSAMTGLGNGLGEEGHQGERIKILEIQLANNVRFGRSKERFLKTKTNLADCYGGLGMKEQALAIYREIYDRSAAISPAIPVEETFQQVINLASSLAETGGYEEAKSLLREQIPRARRALGTEHENYIKLLWCYAATLSKCGESRDDRAEAVTSFEELLKVSQRVFGPAHPFTNAIQQNLELAISKLAAFDAAQ